MLHKKIIVTISALMFLMPCASFAGKGKENPVKLKAFCVPEKFSVDVEANGIDVDLAFKQCNCYQKEKEDSKTYPTITLKNLSKDKRFVNLVTSLAKAYHSKKHIRLEVVGTPNYPLAFPTSRKMRVENLTTLKSTLSTQNLSASEQTAINTCTITPQSNK